MGGWTVGYFQSAQELNSGPPKPNPSSNRKEVMKPGPPDYKSSALPLGHDHLLKTHVIGCYSSYFEYILLLVTSYCFITVTVVMVLGQGAFFLLFVIVLC